MIETKDELKVGDKVKLLGVPKWLIDDIPSDEQLEIISFIGQLTEITEIDSWGYYWLGFGKMEVSDETSYYRGHTFCVTREFLIKVS